MSRASNSCVVGFGFCCGSFKNAGNMGSVSSLRSNWFLYWTTQSHRSSLHLHLDNNRSRLKNARLSRCTVSPRCSISLSEVSRAETLGGHMHQESVLWNSPSAVTQLEGHPSFPLYGPSLQRGCRPDRKPEMTQETCFVPVPEGEDECQSQTVPGPTVVSTSPSELLEDSGRSNVSNEGVSQGALEKLHEAWAVGTWGGEKLSKWDLKEIDIGTGWRVKAALTEFDALKREESAAEQKEMWVRESNLVNAREVSERLVKKDGRLGKFLKGADLDRGSFTRVYNIAALRVPVEECGALVDRLKGHLLNWPRVKNVARVTGDDGDLSVKRLLWEEETASQNLVDSVRHAVYDGHMALSDTIDPIKREKKCRLPKSTKLSNGGAPAALKSIVGTGVQERPLVRGSSRRAWEEGAVSVEVVEGTHPCLEIPGLREQSMSHQSSLPGVWASWENGGSIPTIHDDVEQLETWREPTRLLLLDERHAGKPGGGASTRCAGGLLCFVVLERGRCEVVQCRLTLAYDYWLMDEVLRELLPSGMLVPTAFESIGHIAHLNLRSEHLPFRHIIAQVVLEKHKPRIRTVVNKTDAIHSKYRTMQLELLAGNSSLVTTVVEHGHSFRIDLASVYWNSRLGTERQRLVESFEASDVVCDVFAGVGPIAVVAATKVRFVYANDLNPSASNYLRHNLVLNRLVHKAEVSNKDGRQFLRDLLAGERPVRMTQVVMNLPLDAAEFLDVFVGAFKKETWGRQALPKIHVYGFSKAADPEAEFAERIAEIVGGMPHPLHMHHVRLVAPRKWMLCASFQLPPNVGFEE